MRRDIVKALREKGMSLRAIAAETGVSVGTVHADLDRSELNAAESDDRSELNAPADEPPTEGPEPSAEEDDDAPYEPQTPLPEWVTWVRAFAESYGGQQAKRLRSLSAEDRAVLDAALDRAIDNLTKMRKALQKGTRP